MEEKQSNLAISIDVLYGDDLLDFANKLGPKICILKTHIDVLEDFNYTIIEKLQAIAKKHNFIIFEDRKFADIGNTVKLQYGKGIYRIADWAGITNAHIIPGPGIIEGLREVGLPKGNGLLLLAEMSSKGSVTTKEYVETAITMAKNYKEFVIGFIAQGRITEDPSFICMTPGIQLSKGSDQLGQQYTTPAEAILDRFTDIIIVGRGIYKATDPVDVAETYRELAWNAYKQRLQDN